MTKREGRVGRRGEKSPRPPFPRFVGGDPSAGSPTDTLLRLNPPCRGRLEYPKKR